MISPLLCTRPYAQLRVEFYKAMRTAPASLPSLAAKLKLTMPPHEFDMLMAESPATVKNMDDQIAIAKYAERLAALNQSLGSPIAIKTDNLKTLAIKDWIHAQNTLCQYEAKRMKDEFDLNHMNTGSNSSTHNSLKGIATEQYYALKARRFYQLNRKKPATWLKQPLSATIEALEGLSSVKIQVVLTALLLITSLVMLPVANVVAIAESNILPYHLKPILIILAMLIPIIWAFMDLGVNKIDKSSDVLVDNNTFANQDWTSVLNSYEAEALLLQNRIARAAQSEEGRRLVSLCFEQYTPRESLALLDHYFYGNQLTKDTIRAAINKGTAATLQKNALDAVWNCVQNSFDSNHVIAVKEPSAP